MQTTNSGNSSEIHERRGRVRLIEVEKLQKMEKIYAYGRHFAKSYRLASYRQPLFSPSDIEGVPESSGYLEYDNDARPHWYEPLCFRED